MTNLWMNVFTPVNSTELVKEREKIFLIEGKYCQETSDKYEKIFIIGIFLE